MEDRREAIKSWVDRLDDKYVENVLEIIRGLVVRAINKRMKASEEL